LDQVLGHAQGRKEEVLGGRHGRRAASAKRRASGVAFGLVQDRAGQVRARRPQRVRPRPLLRSAAAVEAERRRHLPKRPFERQTET
jgi:hypothetical protein